MDDAAIARMRMRAQRLWGPRFSAPQEALRWLTAAQAQEFAYARWSLAQRTRRPDAGSIDRAFDEGLVLRTHVLRPTWHFVAPQDLRWLIGLSGPRVNESNARRYRELGLDDKTLARATDAVAEAVAGRQLTRRELGAVLERRKIGTQGQRLPHILMRAELDGRICSGAVRGNQHTYAAFDERVPAGPVLDRNEALAELARRFFAARGPATLRDFAWWSGLAMRDARTALDSVRTELEQRVVSDRTFWLLDAADARGHGPRIDPVQCYDESIISYTQSRDVLQTRSVTFPVPRNLDGFVHVLLCDGRLLGHWRHGRRRGDAAIETRVGRRLNAPEQRALADAVRRYEAFLADAEARTLGRSVAP